jgi:hypothetical protein
MATALVHGVWQCGTFELPIEHAGASLIGVQLDIHFPLSIHPDNFCHGWPLIQFVTHSRFGLCSPCIAPPFVTRHSLADQFGIHGSYFLLLPLLPVIFPNFSVVVTLYPRSLQQIPTHPRQLDLSSLAGLRLADTCYGSFFLLQLSPRKRASVA